MQRLLLRRIGDFNHRQHLAPGRQFFQASTDGGQGGFVADQQVAVENVRHDHRASWPADIQVLTDLRLLGPGRRRAIAMQHEVDIQLADFQVVASWRVVAHGRLRAVALDGERRAFQRRLLGGVLREQQLDVIVAAQADKAR